MQDVRPAAKLTAKEVRADVNLIQEVLRSVMIKGVHYDVVPGCGDKPSLLKPGAEKIMVTFRLSAEPVVEDLSNADEIRYRISLKLTHQTSGTVVGWGVGEASSNETKYKWIAPQCKEEFEETPEDRRRHKWKRGYKGEAASKIMQIRANISDGANTILKMAKKRALVDAVLTSTAASDLFTQDIEDMEEGLAANVAEKAKAAQTASVQRAAPPVQNTAPAPVQTPVATQPDPADNYYEEEPTQAEPVKAAKRATVDWENAIKMAAKFTSDCKFCSQKIVQGNPQVWVKVGATKGAYHPDCVQ